MERITERSNVLTKDIDVASIDGIVRLLRASDAQLFAGYDIFPSVYDSSTLDALEKISIKMKQAISDNRDGKVNSNVFMSGCGTSGRIAYFCARNFNYCIRKLFGMERDCFQFLIAGGINALVSPVEAAEDKPDVGINDLLHSISENQTQRGLYIGITCGLSAAYVAGQILHLSEEKSLNIDSVLFGFNPENMARDSPIESWRENSLSFKSVVEKAKSSQQREDEFVVLNPVVGPEAITGSTRMKGGSATKFLLDVAFSSAVVSLLGGDQDFRNIIIEVLRGFEQTVRCTYDCTRLLAEPLQKYEKPISYAIEMGANSLKHEVMSQRNESEMGHIYYIGCGNAGILGFVDASECVPTYGAHEKDVRGFIRNGWSEIFSNQNNNNEMEKRGENFNISFTHFKSHIMDTVNERDSIFFVVLDYTIDKESFDEMQQLCNEVKQKNATVCWIAITSRQQHIPSVLFGDKFEEKASVMENIKAIKDMVIITELPHVGPVPFLFGFAELSLKLLVNAITTGAHVLKGMTYGNRMINLKVSNNKLFFRAINIVSTIMKVSEEKAQECVIRAIYDDTQPDSNLVSQYIKRAVQVSKVVPVALLLANGSSSGCKTVKEAREQLAIEPVVRNAILKNQMN